LESFIGEIQSEVANITNEVGGVTKEISKIVGSISGAMSFSNIKLSVFGCDLSPNLAVSDFFTLDGGGGGQPHSQLPSSESINGASTVGEQSSSSQTKQYATPPKNQPKVTYNPAPQTTVRPTT
jgi:hypothetical protein